MKIIKAFLKNYIYMGNYTFTPPHQFPHFLLLALFERNPKSQRLLSSHSPSCTTIAPLAT